MRWILDGYNIILSDEKLARIARRNLEAARNELANELSLAAKPPNDSHLLVFDGRADGSAKDSLRNLEIRFTNSGESADDFIKNIIGGYRKRGAIRTVSNDLSIINYTRECGAVPVSTAEFLRLIRMRSNRRNDEETSSEKPQSISKSDLDLLELFKGEK